MEIKRMLLNIKRFSAITILLLGLSACGGDSNSGGGEPFEQDFMATECVTFANLNRRIQNSCNFDIVVRIFAGDQTPVTIPANGAADNPDVLNADQFFGACEAPFTPTRTTEASNVFACFL